MKPKTFLYILTALAIIAIGIFLAYQLIPHNNTTTSAIVQTGSLPGTTNQQFPVGAKTSTIDTFTTNSESSSSVRFGIVSTDQVFDYFVNNANMVTIIKPDGVIESLVNNVTSTISTVVFKNIITASFSYDGKKALISSRVGTTTQTGVFDLATKTWTTLPMGMMSPVWSPTTYQIAYLSNANSGVETLFIITVGISPKPATLQTLSMEDSLLQWPSKNIFIISDRPSAFAAGSLWSLNTTNNILSSISFESLGLESIWDGSGAGLIFSTKDNNQGGVIILKKSNSDQKTLSFVTLPSKCTFHKDIISTSTPSSAQVVSTTKQTPTSTMSSVLNFYCGIPRDQNTLSIARLPDEYDQRALFTADDIYRINTTDGTSINLLSDQTIDATNLKVFNNILFFVNRYDQELYALTLL